MSLESLARISDLTGFAPRTVKDRCLKLVPIREGRATLYETRDALPLCYQVQHGQKQFDLEQERARLAHHQANREALKESEDRGEYIPAHVVREFGAATIVAVKVKIMAIASKLRGRFPDAPQPLIDAIAELHAEALRELGTSGLHDELVRRLSGNNATAGPNGESVGRTVRGADG